MATHEMCLFSKVSENVRVVIQWKIKNNEQTPVNHVLKETFVENFMTIKLLKCRKHYEGKFQHTPLISAISCCCTSMITKLIHHYHEMWKHYEGKFQHTPLDFSYFLLLYIYDNMVDASLRRIIYLILHEE
mgnify:CR=1 FL=1